ncbi:MAG: redoxin domain-containing protein [Pirellulales bacterium]|nr:redoxin domain-containing protein [Pirellulales bacterium]
MKARQFAALAVVGIFISDTYSALAQPQDASPIGRRVSNFKLRDCYGKERALGDLGESKVVVVAFLGTECPLAKLYGPRLEKLRREFADQGVAFIGINSNTQDSITELAAYRERHKIGFPLLNDPGNKVADDFKAERTPEVFVLDAKRKIRYWGRIDDQYHIGIQRDNPKRQDLAIAVRELLAGKKVSTPVTEAVGCHIGRVQTVKPKGDITYSKHIAPIFNRRCVECHRNDEIAPFPLTDYDEIEGWGDTIAEVIEDGRMPPWTANPKYGHFSNDARLTDDEKKLIFAWVNNGMPEGDPADLPEPPKFAEGWRIPEPDVVIAMSDKPFKVPAEGVVDYQYFTVDPGFKEDKYVMAAECKPGNRAVVHHIIAYIQPPGAESFRRNGAIDGYSPGSPPKIHRDGLATYVPAGSKIVFEMHYTPNGSPQEDISSIGIKFIDKSKVKKVVRGDLAINTSFEIPPGDNNYKVTARRRVRRDVMLLNLNPHMHLRGKSFRYEAEYPDGASEILLDVPRYDFNWQLRYELAKPLLLPKGTTIYCTAHFDNSEENLANPDPTKTVRWGNQSWEEMMIGFYNIVPAEKHEVAAFWKIRKPVAKVATKTVDPSGIWRWEHKEGLVTVKNVLTVKLDGEDVTGTYRGKGPTYKILKGQMKGDSLSFEFPVEASGRKVNIEFVGKIEGNELDGTVSFVVSEGSFDVPWKATRDERMKE